MGEGKAFVVFEGEDVGEGDFLEAVFTAELICIRLRKSEVLNIKAAWSWNMLSVT